MNTTTRSQYKIWRNQKGRSLKRWLTDEQVAHYKSAFPHWRWQKIQVENRSYQASLQQARETSSLWGRWRKELVENRALLQNTNNPVISYDDIIDVQLELKKGI